MRAATAFALVAFAALAAGCFTRHARLYDLDRGTSIALTFGERPGPSGWCNVVLPSGELLEGEYTVMREQSAEWGRVHATALGAAGSATASAFASSFALGGQAPGVALLTSPAGTLMECEFVASPLSGNATGACRDNRGGRYRMIAD